MTQYTPIFALLVLAVLFAGLSFFASGLLAPRRPTAAKSAPYECGIVPDREPAQRFPVRFYLVAMLFIIFDIEIIFIYPWAVIFKGYRQVFLLVEMLTFAAAVFVAFVYILSHGALDWGPLKRLRPMAPVSPARTSESTVRRLGREAGDEAA
jgi:NADH-quinone oxidoreductase subunit A